MAFNPAPTDQNHSAISIRGLSFYKGGHPILQAEIDFSDRGISAIIGDNGAGKSLLIKLIANMAKPISGHIVLHSPFERPVLMLQKIILLNRTVLQNLCHALAVQGLARKHRRRQAMGILEKVGIADLSEVYSGDLSGGQERLVAFARCLCLQPRLFILDEPFANLNLTARQRMIAIIKSMASQGVKVIIVSHQLAEVESFASEAILVEDGCVRSKHILHPSDKVVI